MLSRLPCHQCGRDRHVTLPRAEHEVAAANILQPLQDATYENLRGAQLADPIFGPPLRGKEVGGGGGGYGQIGSDKSGLPSVVAVMGPAHSQGGSTLSPFRVTRRIFCSPSDCAR